MISRPFATGIIILVTIVWAANFGLQFVPGLEYKSDPLVHGIFAMVAGVALGFRKDADGGQSKFWSAFVSALKTHDETPKDDQP